MARKFPDIGNRPVAIWHRAPYWIAAVCASALLAGCSTADDPAAPETTNDLGLDGNPALEYDKVISGSEVARDEQGNVARLAFTEPTLGRWLVEGVEASEHVYIEPGVPLQFTWRGVDPFLLSGTESYRWGWDVNDPDDLRDPGWCVPPGCRDENFHTDEVVFWDGLHELTVEWRDGERLLVRLVFGLSAAPVVPRGAADGAGDIAVDDATR